MTDELLVDIVEYNDDMAEDLAAMYNTWDELWPGGFTQGIPYDADRVRKNFGKMNAIAILIALDKETGKPVGSCTLHEHWRDDDAAYIGTLGVSPEALSKKVGKHLLLESVRRVRERGLGRVDLNTWAGNTRAVPLYKKIGLMWNPAGEGLVMEAYVPAILENKICRPFFEKHAKGEDGWYQLHRREIVQAPDDMTDRNMAIYRYRFDSGDDAIEVIVDRLARGICGIKRTMNGNTLSIRSLLTTQNGVCGFEERHVVEIENSTPDDFEVELKLDGPKGLQFSAESKTKLSIPKGETISWEVPFVFGTETELFRVGIKAPSIRSTIRINGSDFALVAGSQVKSAAQIYERQGYCRLSPGGTSTLPLTIASNLNDDVEATIYLDAPNGISAKLTNERIRIPAGGPTGTSLSITADSEIEEGTHDIWVWMKIQQDHMETETRKHRIPIFCLGKNAIAVGENDRKKRIVVVTPRYVAECFREGGILRVENPLSPDIMTQTFQTSVGPPFGLSPFRFAERDLKVDTSTHETTVTLSAKHPDRPLIVEDKAIFEHNTGIIRREVWAKNIGADEHTFQVRIVGRQVGVMFNQGTGFYPLPKGVVAEPIGAFRMSYPVLSSEPNTLDEGWVATEGITETIGCLWNSLELEEVRVGAGTPRLLSSKIVSLKPNEHRKAISLTMVWGASSWRDVRRLWKARVKGIYEHGLEPEQSPKMSLDVTAHSVAISGVDATNIRTEFVNMIPAPIKASLHVRPPDGWRVDDGMPAEIMVHDKEVIDFKLKPSPDIADEFGVHRGRIQAASTTDYSSEFEIVHLGASTLPVAITREKMQGKEVFRVSNGNLEFLASAEYGGCLFSLKNKNDVEFLISSYPDPKPRPGGFLDNYYGGIQPIIFDEESNVDLAKAKTNRESMKIRECADGPWTGVEITWTGSIQNIVRGADFSLKYLTAPGSPLVLVKWRFKNKTDAPLRFFPIIMADPAINKDPAALFIETEWAGHDRQVRPGPAFNSVAPSSGSMVLRPREPSLGTRGLGFIATSNEIPMLAAHGGAIILEALLDVMVFLQPGEERELKQVMFIDPQNSEDMQSIQRASRFF